MKKLILIAALALAGCSHGSYKWDSETLEYAKLNFIGVPSIIGVGMTGSSTPVTESLSVTNKHVAYPLLKTIVDKSKNCDVALIAQNNKGEKLHQWAQLDIGDEVTFYGYSGFTVLPVSSTGKVVKFSSDGGCRVALTTAGGVGGMSGGAVVNKEGKLVGIVRGLNIGSGLTVVIPYQSFDEIMPISIRDQVKKDYSHGN